MKLKIVQRTCSCGAVFETGARNKKLCDPCQQARRKAMDYAWYDRHREEHKMRMRKKRAEEKARRLAAGEVKELYPVKEWPCLAGCGAMVQSRTRNGQVYCPACLKAKRAEHNAKYRHSAKGKAQQAAANQRKAQDPQLLEKKRERDRLRYREKRAEILAKAEQARRAKGIMPKPPRPPKPPKPAPLVTKPRAPRNISPTKKVEQMPPRRLPTEAEKLAMLRAALRRYHGE